MHRALKVLSWVLIVPFVILGVVTGLAVQAFLVGYHGVTSTHPTDAERFLAERALDFHTHA